MLGTSLQRRACGDANSPMKRLGKTPQIPKKSKKIRTQSMQIWHALFCLAISEVGLVTLIAVPLHGEQCCTRECVYVYARVRVRALVRAAWWCLLNGVCSHFESMRPSSGEADPSHSYGVMPGQNVAPTNWRLTGTEPLSTLSYTRTRTRECRLSHSCADGHAQGRQAWETRASP